MTVRSLLYALARFLGDANAVRRGRVGRRVERRAAGHALGAAAATGGRGKGLVMEGREGKHAAGCTLYVP